MPVLQGLQMVWRDGGQMGSRDVCVESGHGLSQFFGLVVLAGGELFAVWAADYDGIPVCFQMAGSMI